MVRVRVRNRARVRVRVRTVAIADLGYSGPEPLGLYSLAWAFI